MQQRPFCVYLASLRYGLTYIPLNTSFQYEELTYFIYDSEPSLFICSPKIKSLIAKISGEKNIKLKIETIAGDGTGSLQEKLSKFKTQFDTVKCSKDDIACILYTSGTTGRPKGAMLSHKNLLVNGLALKEYWGFTKNDVLLHILPIYHCHGLFFASHCVLLSGSQMIFLPKFDTELIINHLPNTTVLMGVPTYYTRLLGNKRFSSKLTKKMRLFTSGSAPLLEKTFFEFKDRIGQEILERYGMTETGIITSNPLNGNRIPVSVGRPLPKSR